MALKATENPAGGEIVVHADNLGPGGEFTACGNAFDAWQSEGGEQTIQTDAAITCPICIATIEEYKNNFMKVRGKWRQK